jgi:hypothetical protein
MISPVKPLEKKSDKIFDWLYQRRFSDGRVDAASH